MAELSAEPPAAPAVVTRARPRAWSNVAFLSTLVVVLLGWWFALGFGIYRLIH
jgi:hypothetical protein